MQELIDKGVLRPSGEIVKDKINLISGAHTPPFVEMLWTVTNGDTDTTNRLYNILTKMAGKAKCWKCCGRCTACWACRSRKMWNS